MPSDRQEPDRGARDLALVLVLEPDVDPDEVERSTRQLRAELTEVDVGSIAPVISDNAPDRAKGIDPSSLGTLLITLGATGGVFTILLHTVRDWLARQATARRISVTIDGDTIVLEKASPLERRELIDAYIRRHEVN